jgi:phosphopantothenoylcysteine decarboxylase / phosphopantothenate---cysteine ligase
VTAIENLLGSAAKPLAGKHVLITAGPTREPIDPVRYISNQSSGKQGYAIAEAAVRLGAQVTLVSGPVALPIPPGVGMMPVQTAEEMLKAVEQSLPADIAIFTAAVADWRVASVANEKIKKKSDGRPPALSLAENPDILRTIASRKTNRPKLVVGFAAETENIITHAEEKLAKKGCDLMVANDVSEGKGVFGGDANTVHLVSKSGVESWPKQSKAEVAERLMRKLAEMA